MSSPIYKPATTIEELIANFNYMQVIDESLKQFYVDIYTKELADIRTKLKLINLFPPNKTFYITGQRGTGKSSALRQLPTKDLNEKLHFVFITFYKDIDVADIDIVDVLLYIGESLINNNPKLLKEFDYRLKELKGLYEGTIERLNIKTTEKNIDFPIKLWAKFIANLDFRKEVREIIRPNLDEFADIVEEIVRRYESDVLKGKKQLVLVLDDLEKMSDINQIRKLFIDSIQYLSKIRTPKLVTFPINLQTQDARFLGQQNTDTYTFAMCVGEECKISEQQEKINRNLFREIVKKRVSKSNLIDDDAIELAIDYSGGILRQFIQLIQEAGVQAILNGSDRVRIIEMEQKIDEISLKLSYSVAGEKVNILREVYKTKNLPEKIDNTVIELLLGNIIIAYPNAKAWYDVNPLVRKNIL